MASQVVKGDKLPVLEKTISQDMITAYAHASGDHNPVHLDPQFASTSHFGGIVAHGMLTLAFLSQSLTQAFGRYWLESGSLKVRFKGPAYPGDIVRTSGEVTQERKEHGWRLVECTVALYSQGGEELLSGTATVWLPSPD